MEGIFCLEQWIRQGTASGDVSRVGGRGKKTDEGFTTLELNTEKKPSTNFSFDAQRRRKKLIFMLYEYRFDGIIMQESSGD